MKAVQFARYGGPEALYVADVKLPEPGPGEIRLQVRCARAGGGSREPWQVPYADGAELPAR